MRGGIVSIGIASAVIATALLVLVYRGGVGRARARLGRLAAVHQRLLQQRQRVAIVLGFAAIRRRRRDVHQRWMLTALASSGVFLASYVTYHALHGDSRFLGQGAVRPIYFAILISHIGLSVVALPLVLSTFYLSLSGRFAAHRRLARWTFPIWLYVSVTGVVVFAMLQIFGAARA